MRSLCRHIRPALIAALAVCWFGAGASADKITLRHSDYFELIRAAGADTVLTFGNVRFVQDDAALICDSAVWIKEVRLHLWGAVRYEADGNLLVADSLVYDLVDSMLYAVGDTVILISSEDSIRAVGSEAFYDRAQERIEMLGRPRVQFQYPDTADGRDVVADYIRYEYSDQSAVAQGGVVLTQSESLAQAACARFDRHPDRIRLYDSASVDWDNYRLIGEYIVLRSESGKPSRVDVWGGGEALLLDQQVAEPDSIAITVDSATGEILVERLDSLGLDSALADSAIELATELAGLAPVAGARLASSRLVGRSLHFMFTDGDLRRIDAHGQAFSFYQPPSEDTLIAIDNTASGDSISLFITHDSLKMVKVYGSVEGVYVERQRPRSQDSLQRARADTINYAGQRITFDLTDSTIALAGRAQVDQAQMKLKSDSIHYETARKFVTAFADTSAETPSDTGAADSAATVQSDRFGNVVLSDGGEEVEGEYVEYSLETGKGLLLQSATQFENAYYTGGELYRRNSDVFFVDQGSYTTCEFTTPHFHFWSKEMKVINNDKMIAKPVVFYIEKLPVFALPYYVFPMRKGRRSGILNFRYGNFNQGGRFIANVGYYWAASEYWDVEAWMDYYEVSGVSLNGRLQWAKRYQFSGNLAFSNSWDSRFDGSYQEVKIRRWSLRGSHRHTFDPTLTMNAFGTFTSDASYFTDFSNDLDDRLNRNLTSQVNFSKSFGSSRLAGNVNYTKGLDDGRITLTAPSLTYTRPALQIFGSPANREDERWYHTIRAGYSPRLTHREVETRKFTIDTLSVDTTIDTTFDTLGAITSVDTTVFTSTVTDTSGTKKSYTTYQHGTSIGPNFSVMKYFPMRLQLNYNETWFKVDETDQSLERGIDTDKFFRTYSTSMSASLSTNLYGTIYPNVFGLTGVRHEFSPRASYSYTPTVVFDSATLVAAEFVGAARGTTSNQAVSFGLGNSFQAKIGEGETERVIELLTLNSSISYDPDATTRRWSDLTTTFFTRIAGLVSMNGSMRHSFYADGGLQNFDINSSVSFRGNFGKFDRDLLIPAGETRNPGGEHRQHKMADSRNWTAGLNHYYSQNKFGDKSHFLDVRLTYQLTANMSVNYRQRYDFTTDRTINRYVEVRRRLHCWEGVFTWTPNGSNQGYHFRINVIDLPDVKYEKSLTSSGVRGRLGF